MKAIANKLPKVKKLTSLTFVSPPVYLPSSLPEYPSTQHCGDCFSLLNLCVQEGMGVEKLVFAAASKQGKWRNRGVHRAVLRAADSEG